MQKTPFRFKILRIIAIVFYSLVVVILFLNMLFYSGRISGQRGFAFSEISGPAYSFVRPIAQNNIPDESKNGFGTPTVNGWPLIHTIKLDMSCCGFIPDPETYEPGPIYSAFSIIAFLIDFLVLIIVPVGLFYVLFIRLWSREKTPIDGDTLPFPQPDK